MGRYWFLETTTSSSQVKYDRFMNALFSDVGIGIIVADVDMTIIPDGHSALSGDNLDALANALQRHIPVLLISGSPYDSVYLGVTTTGSLHRRVTTPLRKLLTERNSVASLHYLTIFYASGRGVVNFDPQGEEIRVPDRTDKDLHPELRPLIFRSFLCGFFAVKTELNHNSADLSALKKIWTSTGSDLDAAALTQQLISEVASIDVGPLEKWAFGSEIALVFHHTTAPGPTIVNWAQRVLHEQNVVLPNDIFWAGGTDFAKASRIRKRHIIEEAVRRWTERDALSNGKIISSFGDSNVDDFLNLYSEPHISIFSGSHQDAVNFPSAWLTVDHQGQAQQQAHAFGYFLNKFLNKTPPSDGRFSLIHAAKQNRQLNFFK